MPYMERFTTLMHESIGCYEDISKTNFKNQNTKIY